MTDPDECPAWVQKDGLHSRLWQLERALQEVPVLKDLFLVLQPVSTWNRLAMRARGPGYILAFYLLPMMFLSAFVEGHGLMLLGREQHAVGVGNRFQLPGVVAYEMLNWLLVMVVIGVAAIFIRSLANACFARNNFSQGLSVMLHAIGPMCLIQLLNGIPGIFLWITWLAGMSLAIAALYQGLPRFLHPDPVSSMGLFVGSAVTVFLLLLGVRIITWCYLAGDCKKLEAWLSGWIAGWLS